MCNTFLLSMLPAVPPNMDEDGTPVDSQYDLFNKRRLHVLHLYVRSLTSKLDEIRCIAGKSKASIIGINKMWLEDSIRDPKIEMPNYVLIPKNRNCEGWGEAHACTFTVTWLTMKGPTASGFGDSLSRGPAT